MDSTELSKSCPLTRPRGILAIPARLNSTRLPRKLLLNDTGQALLAHVIENARQVISSLATLFSGLTVVCGDSKLANVARQTDVKVIPSSGEYSCGTSRIADALPHIQNEFGQVDFVLNWQADQVLVHAEAVQSCVEALFHSPGTEMATIAIRRLSNDLIRSDSSTVKVSVCEAGWATDFRRDDINEVPSRNGVWCQHVGLYAYRTSLLTAYFDIPPSPREQPEQLEQLRFLDSGHQIRVSMVPQKWAGQSINTLNDYNTFVETLSAS